jgi:hypothetical protein
MLFGISNGVWEPTLLSVGGKNSNYESLATYLAQEESSASSSSAATDTVDLALDKVAGKVVLDLASLTAGVIKEYPEIEDDYVLAIIEDGGQREVRAYSREDILASFKGSEEERAALEESLDKDPLVVYSSAEGLPPTSDSEALGALASKAQAFLTTNEKLLNLLETYGYNPFTELKL